MDPQPLPRRGGRLSLAERSALSGIGSSPDFPTRPGPAPAGSPTPSSSSTTATQAAPAAATWTTSVPAGWVRVTHPEQAHPRHVWVTDPPGARGTYPGLLAQWQHRPTGWVGYVVTAIPDGPDVVTVRAWLPAERLRPA